MFTTGGFEFRPPPDDFDEVWAGRKPRASFSRGHCGRSNYAHGGSSLRVNNLISLPSTDGTHLGAQISRSSYLSSQRSYHGSQDGLEADFETGSAERMESLVSGLLQDEGREYQNGFPVLASDVSTGSMFNSISSRGHYPEAESIIKGLQMQCLDQFETNYSFVRARDDQGFDPDRLRGNNVSAMGRFPSSEMSSHEETPYHQIFDEHESAFKGSCSADDVKLSCLPRSQQPVNSTMIHELQEQMAKITLRDRERAYAVQQELEEMEAHNREYATELQVKKSIEATRALNAYADSAADVGQFANRENLFNPEDLVRDLRAIANSIEQTSLLERNSSWRTIETPAALCKWPCQQGCPTSNTDFENVKNDIREGNRVRSHAQNVESTHSGPSASRVRSQWTSGPGCSSPRASDNSMFPTLATACNSAAAVARSAASGLLSPGRRQETSFDRSRHRNAGKKPDVHLRNADSPPKRKIQSPCRKTGSVQTSRGADHNMKVKFASVTGFHPSLTPTSASPLIKCAQNGNTETASIFSANDFRSFQTLLPKEKGSKHHAAFCGHDAGSSDGSSVRLQTIRKTKALIAQGAKSISVLLKAENSALRGKTSYPVSSTLSDSAPESTGSERNKSDDTLQLIPSIERPSVELDVCNQGQFKTELCNNWQATQYCPYGDLCRFAHGVEQLRCVLRHPRYKTIPCRMILQGKACMYGHRCHFRHSLTTEELSLISVIDVHDNSHC